MFKVNTAVVKLDECLFTCFAAYEFPSNPCEMAHHDATNQKCYLGNFQTDNQGSITLPSGTSLVYIEQGNYRR